MTKEAYDAIAECARRRIGHEWNCTDGERAVLSLVNELSNDLGQSLALVPCLGDFAAITGVHKSTISRAIRSALKKGYIEILRRKDETLYRVCIETPGEASTNANNDGAAVRARLVQLNQSRLQGTADVSGQQRLPGILQNEETEAPARAFSAMLDRIDSAPPVLAATPPPTIARPPQPEPQPDPEDRLARLQRTMEERRANSGSSDPKEQSRAASTDREAQWAQASTGLQGQALFALELVRDECAKAGSDQEAAFYQYRMSWRNRAERWPVLLSEAAGVHKAMRLEGKGADMPGAFIYRTLQSVLAMAKGP